MYRVTNTDFNRQHYPNLVGKVLKQAPSYANVEDYHPMTCDQCNPMVVSTGMVRNVFLHEHGCPNDGKKWDSQEGKWVSVIQCPECGCDVEEGETCCFVH